jgi:hypothetical protein
MDDLSATSNRTVKSAQQVILTGAEEKILFHQFNYARYRVWKIQQDVSSPPNRQPTPEQAEEILRWYRLSPTASASRSPRPTWRWCWRWPSGRA